MFIVKTTNTQEAFYKLDEAKIHALKVNADTIVDYSTNTNRVIYQDVREIESVKQSLTGIDYLESITAQGYYRISFNSQDRNCPCEYIFNKGIGGEQ